MSPDENSNCIRVAIVEDRKKFRQQLVRLLNNCPGLACVADYSNPQEALSKLPDIQPDVILLDIDLSAELTGIDCIRPLKRRLPNVQILMLTVLDQLDLVYRAVRLGACGYLRRSTSPERLVEIIREVHQGGSAMSPDILRLVLEAFQASNPDQGELGKLSPREREILELLAQGFDAKDVAQTLDTSYETVRTQVKRAREKLQVSSVSDAVKKAFPEKHLHASVRNSLSRGLIP